MNARPKLAATFVLLALAALAACLPAVAQAAAQPSLTLTAAPETLVNGASTTLTTGGCVPGATLTLSRMRAGEAGYTAVDTAVADASGAASWKRKPTCSTAFRLDLAAGETWAAASAEVSVGVRPRISLDVVVRRPILETRQVRYTVAVRPDHPGGVVQLQRQVSGAWEPLRDLTLGSDSKATVTLPAGKPGRLVVRAEMAADADHLSGHSEAWKTTVYDRRNPYGVPTKYPHLILVDLSQYRLYYHEHGQVIRVFDCVLGRPGLPTPRGHYRIYAKDPHIGGPYGPFRMRYLGLFAIHGTNEPWLLSHYPRNYSHGCTRLSNANITWLYSRVHVGTPVWNVP